MSVENLDADVELDAEANAATITVTEQRHLEIEGLFDENGELRLWEDSRGWEGYTREVIEDEIAFYYVDTHHEPGDWLRKVRVGEGAVRDAVRAHIADPEAGEIGQFERSATRAAGRGVERDREG